MSTVDLLRRAESLLREYATASEEQSRGRWTAIVLKDGALVASPVGSIAHNVLPDAARLMALLDPPVALALAEVMERAHQLVEEAGPPLSPNSTIGRLVNLARAILREDSDA